MSRRTRELYRVLDEAEYLRMAPSEMPAGEVVREGRAGGEARRGRTILLLAALAAGTIGAALLVRRTRPRGARTRAGSAGALSRIPGRAGRPALSPRTGGWRLAARGGARMAGLPAILGVKRTANWPPVGRRDGKRPAHGRRRPRRVAPLPAGRPGAATGRQPVRQSTAGPEVETAAAVAVPRARPEFTFEGGGR